MFTKYRLLIAIIASFGSIYAQSTVAAVQGWWTLDYKCVSGGCDYTYSNSRTFEGDHGNRVTTTAWANTEPGATNNQLAPADIAQWGGGLGVRNADIGTLPNGEEHDHFETRAPEHAMDNNERFEMILFEFEDSSGNNLEVALDTIAVGWYRNDADISVLAYDNTLGAPDLNGLLLSDGQQGLTGAGWQIVGNYDVDSVTANTDVTESSTHSTSINDANISSSYWLIGAYNTAFGTLGCNGKCEGGNGNYDYLKIQDLVGSIVDNPQPPTSVPEPGSLLLLASTLFIAPGLRRRRNKKMQVQ